MTKEEIMFKEVEIYLSSEMTQRDFIKDKDYSYHSLKYWLAKYRKQERFTEANFEQGHFQEIDLNQSDQGSKKLMEITSRSGVHIIIYH